MRKQFQKLLVMPLLLFGMSACKKNTDNPISVPTAIATETAEKPNATNEFGNVTIEVDNQVVYQLSDIDFRFAIVTLHVQAENATNISLDHFVTEEGIKLNEVQTYVQALEERSYFLGRQNVWFSLVSQKNEYDVNIFVPVKEASLTSLRIDCDFLDAPLTIDLSRANGNANDLIYQANDVITDGDTYQLTVSQAYDITGEYLYRQIGGVQSEYLLPSTTKVYAFKIEAISLWGDTIVITGAEYVPSGTAETFTALDDSIRSEKFSNIIGRQIDEKDSGYLFFFAYDPDDHPVTYTGTLKLTLQGQTNPIMINVNLN